METAWTMKNGVFTKDKEVVNKAFDELTVTLADSLKCSTEDAEIIARQYINMCLEICAWRIWHE